MPIFTFMGASVVRKDDSYSFEVITKTLDTVIPALIQVCDYCSALVLTALVDNTLLDLPNCSDDTKAKFNNCLLFTQKKFPVLKLAKTCLPLSSSSLIMPVYWQVFRR